MKSLVSRKRSFGLAPQQNIHCGSALASAFTAPVGRGETRGALNLRIVLPGVKREDLRVTVESELLRLSGERHPPIGFAEDGHCHFAMPYGVFAQDVPLPDGLDISRMQTRLHEGVLDVHIPFASLVAQTVSAVATPVLPDIRAECALLVAV